MNNMIKVLLVVFISFLSSPSWSETVSMDDLVWRDALWYKKFTDVPFTGEVSGKDNGKIKNGNVEGLWIFYYNSGQLYRKENYKNGRRHGYSAEYHENGIQLVTGHYKNRNQDGLWVYYNKFGQLYLKTNYKDGNRHGLMEIYSSENGSLLRTHIYNNGVEQ